MNIQLTVAYDGTEYCGFQRQRPGGRPSIQEELEKALECLLRQAVRVAGAGRTDAGVHAEKQVVSFTALNGIPMDRFPYAVNRLLPPEIVVTGAREVDEGFHARFSARSKVYRYTLWRERFPSPFWRRYAWHWPGHLDDRAMALAAAAMTGRRDFSAMGASGRPVRESVRTVFRCDIETCGPLLVLRVEGNGFLYKMVRTMVGTLVEVGRGRWDPGRVEAILASRDRRQAGPTAPAHGLCLEDVTYG